MTQQQELEATASSQAPTQGAPAQRDRSGAERLDTPSLAQTVYVTSRPILGIGSARGIAAWMIVPPVDAVMLLLPLLWAPEHFKAIVLMAAVSIALLFGAGRYRARLHLSVLDEIPTLLGRLLTAAAVVATLFALVNQTAEVGPFLGLLLGTIGLVLAGRFLTTTLILTARRRRIVAHKTIIVGGGVRAAEMATLLNRYPQYGLVPLGFVDDDGDGAEAGRVIGHLGEVQDLELLVPATGADVLLVADGNLAETELLDIVRSPECEDCDLLVIPRLPQFHTQVGHVDHIGSVPVMRIRNPSLEGPSWAVKRAFDVVISGLALLVLAPIMAMCALAVRLEGGPGVLFRQDRVGRDGQLFSCLKFRSMKPATFSESATQWNIANDKRVGPVGKVLRRSSLDELPQLWSILRGDMTLVGPRPERPHFVDKFSIEVDRYAHRHRVRAGLTGLAQVSGLRGDTPISDRARFDNYYIENWSLWLDAKVILRTFGEVIFARGR
ncbi:sugar transferase [Actinomycetospora sp. NBRC 106378]|uniref:sugar transferase n=1 Tax=Actinomycetospora sp. NBRC 106378 TaxID=3032208 RepID=UPI0024A19CC3|nr:sugar transferase [Actinomycetospora sp. NBRC 106378]GLZ51696.1 UDP-phosphate galactose phosphotransferase [Actinomycetospora sp. NBRC 106378]